MASAFKDASMVEAEMGSKPSRHGVVHRALARTNGLRTTPNGCKAAFEAAGLKAADKYYSFQGKPYRLADTVDAT